MSSRPIQIPRTKPADERRADLLDAAQETLLERGAAALTVGEVTARAGVAKGSFYLQFKTKDDVLAALRDRIGAEILAEHRSSLAGLPADDHGGRLERWLADAIDGRLRRAELHDALFQPHAGAVHTGVGSADPHIAMLAGLLADGVAAGEFALRDAGTTAVLLYSAMHGAVDALVRRGGDPEPLVAAMLELARRAVRSTRA